MKIYYIAKVEDDSCLLKTRRGGYELTVPFSELSEVAKKHIIVGYNKITNKVKVTGSEDVVNYVNTKRKLVGKPPRNPDMYVIEEAKTEYDPETGIMRIYVSDKVDSDIEYDCLYDYLSIHWSYISFHSKIHEINPKGIELYIDVRSYERMYGNSPTSIFSENHITKVEFINKQMFKNCKRCETLINFNLLIDFNLYCKKVYDYDELILDMEGFEVNPDIELINFSDLPFTDLKVPKELYNSGMGNLCSNGRFSRDVFFNIVKTMPVNNATKRNSFLVDEIYYSDFTHHKNLVYTLEGNTIKRLIIDETFDNWYQPFNSDDNNHFIGEIVFKDGVSLGLTDEEIELCSSITEGIMLRNKDGDDCIQLGIHLDKLESLKTIYKGGKLNYHDEETFLSTLQNIGIMKRKLAKSPDNNLATRFKSMKFTVDTEDYVKIYCNFDDKTAKALIYLLSENKSYGRVGFKPFKILPLSEANL